jgi:hypothetical protein
VAWGLILASAAVATATLTGAAEIHLSAAEVRLGEVARLEGMPAGPLSRLVVARLPQGARRQVSRAQLAQLVRDAVPGLRIAPFVSGAVMLVARDAPAPKRAANCFDAVRSIPAGVPVTRDAVTPGPCERGRKAVAVRWAPGGEAIAAAAIEPGSYLGQVALAAPSRVKRGDVLTLVAAAGPVEIRRRVSALQTATGRQRRLFVRAEDGVVFSARLPAGNAK